MGQEDEYRQNRDGYGEYDRGLAEFAFDVLSLSKTSAEGMNALLDSLGKQYGLEQIRIVRLNYENRTLEEFYHWKGKVIVISGEPQIYGHFVSAAELEESFGDRGIRILDRAPQGRFPDIDSTELVQSSASIYYAFHNSRREMIGYISYESGVEERIWTEEEKATICFISKMMTHFLLVSADNRRSSLQIDRLRNYDKVTGLYLYGSFKKEIARVIPLAKPGKLAIVNSDISNFKYINDTYGIEVGDKILRAFAEKCVTNNRFCVAGCRVYADNFITLVRVGSRETLAQKIVEVNEEFEQEQRALYPSSNFTIHTGAYIIDRPEEKLVHILDGAGMAKKTVKEKRGLRYAFFDNTMRDMVVQEGRILAELKKAILKNDLVPFLQPKFSLETKEVIGAEALVRWRVNEKDYYYPNDFIPVLEKTGNIIEVDFCIYRQILSWMRHWLDDGKKIVPVSVNISRVDCRHADFEQELIRLADQYQIPHELIEFEITESAFFENAGMLMEKLAFLREAGFLVSLDDFGSGYSSLSQLSRMPIDIIKMDQSFLRDNLVSERSESVIEAMIHLADRMDLNIICEGVETQEQVEFLLRCGCHMGQGYVFARPMPMEEFEAKYL